MTNYERIKNMRFLKVTRTLLIWILKSTWNVVTSFISVFELMYQQLKSEVEDG